MKTYNEPWQKFSDGTIRDQENNAIMFHACPDGYDRRFMAAVNFCAKVPTKVLQQKRLVDVFSECERLIAANERLLNANRKLVEQLEVLEKRDG